ncbi:MAG: PIN domain-containing protein [Burkholderiales bacterium]
MSQADDAGRTRRLVVLDTNIVLDLLVFDDPRVGALKTALQFGSVQWLATRAMRDELARVLGYPNIVAWSARRGRDPDAVCIDVLAGFDAHAHIVADASPAPLLCSDPDDQGFIDLAWAHGAALVSNDRAVIDVWKRLGAGRTIEIAATAAPSMQAE